MTCDASFVFFFFGGRRLKDLVKNIQPSEISKLTFGFAKGLIIEALGFCCTRPTLFIRTNFTRRAPCTFSKRVLNGPARDRFEIFERHSTIVDAIYCLRHDFSMLHFYFTSHYRRTVERISNKMSARIVFAKRSLLNPKYTRAIPFETIDRPGLLEPA